MSFVRWLVLASVAVLSSPAFAGPLLEAAQAGNLEVARQMVKAGTTAQRDGDNGLSLLHHAVAEGQLEMVSVLLEGGADANLVGADGRTPLGIAAARGRPKIAQLLLERGANRYAQSTQSSEESPICIAALAGKPETVLVLLGKKSDYEYGYGDIGCPVMEKALTGGHEPTVKLLVKRGFVPAEDLLLQLIAVKDQKKLGWVLSENVALDQQTLTELGKPINRELANFVLDQRVSVDAYALMLTVFKTMPDFFTIVMEKRPKLNYSGLVHGLKYATPERISDADVRQLVMADQNPKSDKSILLHAAVQGNNKAMAAFLLAQGMGANARDEFGNIPLHWASQNGNVELARELIKGGSNMRAVSDWGNTPLHRAVPGNFVTLSRALLDAGADVNAKNELGNTALHLAARRGLLNFSRMLVGKGANVKAKNVAGDTALHAAVVGEAALAANPDPKAQIDPELVKAQSESLQRRHQTVLYLMTAGADATAKNAAGKTPRDLAVGNDQLLLALDGKIK